MSVYILIFKSHYFSLFAIVRYFYFISHQVFTLSGETKKKCGETLAFKEGNSVYEFECEYVIADQIKIEMDGILTLCEVEVYGEKCK